MSEGDRLAVILINKTISNHTIHSEWIVEGPSPATATATATATHHANNIQFTERESHGVTASMGCGPQSNVLKTMTCPGPGAGPIMDMVEI